MHKHVKFERISISPIFQKVFDCKTFFEKVMHNFSTPTDNKNIKQKGGKSMANQTYRPGDEVDQDVTLYVKDANGNTLGEIRVPAGHRVPPTRIKDAESYSTNK